MYNILTIFVVIILIYIVYNRYWNSNRIPKDKLNFKKLDDYITIDRSILLKRIFDYYSLFENLKNLEVQNIDYETNEVFFDNQKLKYDFIFLCDGIFSKLKKN